MPSIYASLQVSDAITDSSGGNFLISFHAFPLGSDPGAEARNGMNPEALARLIFLDMPHEVSAVEREKPAEDPGFRIPAGFEWFGAATAGAPQPAKVTAFRTSLPLLRARQLLLESLLDAGWRHESSSDQSETFLIPEGTRVDRICRGQEVAALRVQEIDGVRYASIHWPGIIRTTRECYGSRVIDRNLEPPLRSSMLGENVPRLEFPDSVKPEPGNNRINHLSNGVLLFNAIRLRSSDTPARIAQHLAPQLSEQGWEREVTWTGERSTGSTWLLRAEGKTPVRGELEIVDLGAGLLDVRFDLKAER